MVRLAKQEDLTRVLEIYQIARNFMRENGNPTQWGEKFPPKELLEEDIKKEQLYVITSEQENETIHGVFAFIIGEDETYQKIENGAWISEDIYGTIHRLASSGKQKGIFAECTAFCKKQINHIRVDTHHDNKKMQYLIPKYGFRECGIIYVNDGSPRIAYEWVAYNI